jgi:hypothetical protein
MDTQPVDAVKLLAWERVRETLDHTAPGWNSDPAAALGTQACAAIERLAGAAGELTDLQHHLRQEMATVRFVLGLPGLPEQAQKELRAHLMRLARLV